MENNYGLQSIVERVRQMEQYMDEVAEALQSAPDNLCTEKELCEKVKALTNYMDSGQWLADYEADERGELPADLKRGVLSQDGLYNLICDVEDFYRETIAVEDLDSMSDFSINDMQQMQKTLQEHYKSIWEPIGPETGKNKLLCYDISAEELKKAYTEKFERNMKRWKA